MVTDLHLVVMLLAAAVWEGMETLEEEDLDWEPLVGLAEPLVHRGNLQVEHQVQFLEESTVVVVVVVLKVLVVEELEPAERTADSEEVEPIHVAEGSAEVGEIVEVADLEEVVGGQEDMCMVGG